MANDQSPKLYIEIGPIRIGAIGWSAFFGGNGDSGDVFAWVSGVTNALASSPVIANTLYRYRPVGNICNKTKRWRQPSLTKR
jgi:hypothetical protein